MTGLAVVMAFAVGRLTLDSQPSTHTERMIERQPIAQHVVQAATVTLTADDVRSIVNEALEAREPAAAAQQTPVDTAALSQAQSVVSTGIADGRWTTDDREHLRGVVDRLNREQAREVMLSLYSAINTGRVKLETDGPPT